jgi:chromosome segregation ATPase
MEVTPIEVIQWLKSEIERQQARVDGLTESQNELGRQITEQQEKKKTLEERLVAVKADLEKAVANIKAEQARMEPELQAVRDENNKKQKAFDVMQKDRMALGNQLADAKRQGDPILQKIALLKDEIKKLFGEIALKKRLVAESSELPKEIEKLRKRLTRALSLKAGYLQKTAFAEELLNESESLRKSIGTSKLQEYKRLFAELQPMVFEE